MGEKMPGRDEDVISTIGPSKIGVKVKNQDGNDVFFRIHPNAQLKKLMHGYCERESKQFSSVAFLFDDCFLQGKQTPEELGMENGTEIYAFYAESLRRSMDVQERLNGQSPVEQQNDHCYKENLDTYTFHELEERTNHSIKQAMTFLKASFDKVNYLTEVQTKNEFLKEFEQKVADRDLVIQQMQKELREANAKIRILFDKQSHLDVELLKVNELINSKGESAQPRKEVSQNEQKRARLNEEEDKKATDDSGRINIKVVNLGGATVFYKVKRSTRLKKIMEAYCDRERKDFRLMRFEYNGWTIHEEQTPDELQINNGDEIHAVQMKRAR